MKAEMLRGWRLPGAAALIGVLIGGTAVALAPGGAAAKRSDVEAIVEDYLLEHPEILPRAMKVLQDREVGKVVQMRRLDIETPFGSAWAGNPQGDVVLVEFFDYACGFCRSSNPALERLLREDKGLKVVWREYPVLGEDSLAAAESSLAAARAGRFRQFYDSLFAAGRPTPGALASARKRAGVTGGSDPAFRREIEKNHALAASLGAVGTPTFVVGSQVLQGAVGYDALKAAIAEARRS